MSYSTWSPSHFVQSPRFWPSIVTVKRRLRPGRSAIVAPPLAVREHAGSLPVEHQLADEALAQAAVQATREQVEVGLGGAGAGCAARRAGAGAARSRDAAGAGTASAGTARARRRLGACLRCRPG